MIQISLFSEVIGQASLGGPAGGRMVAGWPFEGGRSGCHWYPVRV